MIKVFGYSRCLDNQGVPDNRSLDNEGCTECAVQTSFKLSDLKVCMMTK